MATWDELADLVFPGLYGTDEWLPLLKDVKIRKKDENQLVMDFLVRESSCEAVKNFIAESGTEAAMDLALLKDLQPVLIDMKSGNFGDAIKKLNDLYPEMLNTNHRLYFRLHLQRLKELSLIGDVDKAIDFGTGFASWCSQHQFPDEELGRIAASLVFKKPENLLDEAQRLKYAKEINEDILTHIGLGKEAILDRLLKMLVWAQNQLDKFAWYPQINDLTKATLGEGFIMPPF